MEQPIETVADLIDALGRNEVMFAAEVSSQQISNWKAQGYITPAKFFAIDSLGRSAGISVPHGLFQRPVLFRGLTRSGCLSSVSAE